MTTVKNKTKGTKKESPEVNESDSVINLTSYETRSKGTTPEVINLEKKSVQKLSVDLNKKGEKVQSVQVIDMSEFSDEQILAWATEHVFIRYIRKQGLNVMSTEQIKALQENVIYAGDYFVTRKSRKKKEFTMEEKVSFGKEAIQEEMKSKSVTFEQAFENLFGKK